MAEVLWAASGAVAAVALLISILRRQFSHIKAQVGKVAVEVSQVNRAVNHVPAGAPTLIERVANTEVAIKHVKDHQRWQSESVRLIAKQIGVDLPSTPPGV